MKDLQLARALGWFSIGLGLAEVLAPRKLGNAIGVGDQQSLLRTMGMREITSGIGILARKNSSGWLWSRVAGDALDLTLLGMALRSRNSQKGRVVAATAAVAGVAILDLICSSHLKDRRTKITEYKKPGGNGRVTKSIIINKSREELFALWRNFENLPQFMTHLKSVTVNSDGTSHWIAKGPLNKDVEWDAKVVDEQLNSFIAWRSLPGSQVETSGRVEFDEATGGRGTLVRVNMSYSPPGGPVGKAVAMMFAQAPEKQIPMDLMRFKQLMETGEISRIQGQSAGRSKSTSWKFDDALQA